LQYCHRKRLACAGIQRRTPDVPGGAPVRVWNVLHETHPEMHVPKSLAKPRRWSISRYGRIESYRAFMDCSFILQLARSPNLAYLSITYTMRIDLAVGSNYNELRCHNQRNCRGVHVRAKG